MPLFTGGYSFVRKQFDYVSYATKNLKWLFTDSESCVAYILNRLAIEDTLVQCPTDDCIAIVCFDAATSRSVEATSWTTAQPPSAIAEITRGHALLLSQSPVYGRTSTEAKQALSVIYADFVTFLKEVKAEGTLELKDLGVLWLKGKSTQ